MVKDLRTMKRIDSKLNKEVTDMKKRFLKILVVLLILVVLPSALLSGCAPKKATYPERAVTIICPWSPGGSTDTTARFMAQEFQKKFGKPFIVVNKTGGGGATGHEAGALAKPDGYTLTFVTLEITTMHWMGLTKVTPNDFDFIVQTNEDPSAVIVRADAPWKNVNELLDDIKKNPGKFMFSGSSAGSIWDLSRIGMLHAAGIPVDSVKWIPTKGAAPAVTELLGGHVDVITCMLPEVKSQIDAGLLRPLAIMADKRDPNYPNVPTLKESGINWSSGTWRGLAAPKGTPKEIINALYNAWIEVSKTKEYKDFMGKMGYGVKIRNPQEFTQFVKEQDQTWKTILKLGGYIKH